MSKSTVGSIVSFTLKGTSPLLQSRNPMADLTWPKKERAEAAVDFENRVWPLKAHTKATGECFIPCEWLKQALVASQKQSAFPIKPPTARKATETMKLYFTSSIDFDDAILLKADGKPFMIKAVEGDGFNPCDAVPLPAAAKIPSTGGSVLVIRPMFENWHADVSCTILHPAINAKMITDCLTWIGSMPGIGSWRPEFGGKYGKFEIKED